MKMAGAIDLAAPLALLCFSLGPASFGIDIEQLATIGDYRGEEGDDLRWLHKALAFREPPAYRDPRILAVKGGDDGRSRPYRLVIDTPEEILEVDWREIRPLPGLLEPLLRPRGLWGVVPMAGTMIMLLDCQRLAE